MERSKPQAFLSSYAPRLRTYNNSLLTPVLPSAPTGPVSRTTKRGTTIINYAEDGYDDLDDDSDDPRRRPTGLRSLRKEDSATRLDMADKVGKEIKEPVDVQGIWRDWMGKSRSVRSDQQNAAQAHLPLTLIPIRIDLDIPSFIPPAPFPAPNPNSVDISLPQYRPQEMTVPYKLRDIFCWNLHETLITTDQFAQNLAQDLDLPNRPAVIAEISKQIRTQLEEYAGVALHPLFHSEPSAAAPPPPIQGGAPTVAGGSVTAAGTPRPSIFKSRDDSPASFARGVSRPETPVQTGGLATPTPQPPASQAPEAPEVTAEATPILPDSDEYNPDDTYRCIINLSLNLSSMLYTDKFEWSLLHPPGTAEAFAKATCADLGLAGEWVPAMTHAIYEAVLRLKKEACEAGGLVGGWGGAQQELPNDAAHGQEAGWRYDPDHLADDWEPKVEFLSKEEMEKREGDRERQIRRLRRETARFSSTTGMLGGTPFGLGVAVDAEEERMGRGERSKKKRRFRSLSPLARGGTPLGRLTPDVGGYGGGVGALTDMERMTWRCSHCRTWGTSVWAVRDGPAGPKSLCANCGYFYERDRRLPRQTKNLHLQDIRAV
ncbi:SNF5 / SMARCB1 / INI1 domain-containing protein [Trichoderma breve]|uniref:SNF5 / SMARCB1 / INI1 domain-containing protein n=1 Tax=Trichoderma breve TaxID=2034170 RepID=A0A9W9BA03_9HYPO|nr:SNF5 / SMARCB1 / INI1 domain-containing protein [Trichoderma breve]KAJ4858692.1 SNF5 / SMARCB1 / INI1 domain-containing protein [Trichoderma breve]